MTDGNGGKKPSRAASEIERIKSAVVAAAEKREHLPQPLFWSLFHAALKDVKAEKDRLREIESLLEK